MQNASLHLSQEVFMFLPFFLAASMLMVSDRNHFWDPDTLSPQTQLAEVNDAKIVRLLEPQKIQRLADKRILLLVHGLNTPEVCYPYFTVQANLANNNASYDEIIGYIWPCYATPAAYLEARKNADKAAPRFRDLLRKLQPIAAKIDVMAHSMGNRLVLEALNFKEHELQLIDHFLSIAPAVDDESIEIGEEYFLSTQHCGTLHVFFSQRDEVLKWVYPIPEWDKALGYNGVQHPKKLPPNVQMINCTAIIDSHDGYLFSRPIFEFVSQTTNSLIPDPSMAQYLLFHSNGLFELSHWMEAMMTYPFWKILP